MFFRQRARLPDKFHTFGFYNNSGINLIDKAKRRKSEAAIEGIGSTIFGNKDGSSFSKESKLTTNSIMSYTQSTTFSTTDTISATGTTKLPMNNSKMMTGNMKLVKDNTKFITIASLTCDLNGLVNRGFLNSPMKMKSELGPECSIYLGAEPVEVNSNRYNNLNVKFSARQRFDENNARLFSTENNYRFLISKFFDKAQAFVPIFKSYIFGLNQRSFNFEAEANLLLNQQQFSKTDT